MNQLQTTLITIPLGKLRTGPYQARQSFDVTELRGLAQTIKVDGLIHPPTVIAVNNHYELIAGDRRRRALFALALEAGGVSLDEAIAAAAGPLVDNLPDRFEVLGQTTIEVNLTGETNPVVLRSLGTVENLQRANLTPTEKARSFRSLLDDGLSLAEVVERTGYNRPQIQQSLDLLSLPEQVRSYVDAGRIPLRVVGQLSKLPTALQVEIADKMAGRTAADIKAVVRLVESRLTVRPAPRSSTEDEISLPPEPAKADIPIEPAAPKPPTIREQLAQAKEIISRLTMQLYLDGRLLDQCADLLAECRPDSRLTLMARSRARQIERAIKSRQHPPTPAQERQATAIESFILKRQRRRDP